MKNELKFSLKYKDKCITEWLPEIKISTSALNKERVNSFSTVYSFKDGMKVSQEICEYTKYHAVYRYLTFENTGDSDSGMISEVCDCDQEFEMSKELSSMLKPCEFYHNAGNVTIEYMKGSDHLKDDFQLMKEPFPQGKNKIYYCEDGLSSSGQYAPFFDANDGEKGVIAAIGWTGQWFAQWIRNEEGISFKSGVKDVNFYLKPGESVRTSSLLLQFYQGDQQTAHNKFRRLIKEHFSLIGKPGRPSVGPVTRGEWGGSSSAQMLKYIKQTSDYQLGIECFWIDAGWYGNCSDEFMDGMDTWQVQVGNWAVNTELHPNGLLDVTESSKKNNLDMLLWVEPERALSWTPAAVRHPEWFITTKDGHNHWLLNLGNREALGYAIDLISDLIDRFGLSYYRQDCNTGTLYRWNDNDEPNRIGITQIKYVMGLYAFWDALLSKYPNLIIDNCAGGGRRFDIEMLSRSIPLWRSDYHCAVDAESEGSQIHNSGISWWIPYCGGRVISVGDIYDMRSSYASALSIPSFDTETLAEEKIISLRRQIEEYKRIRPYFSCDFYPIFGFPTDNTSWSGWQYDRPEGNDGIVIAFRRPECPCDRACVQLGGLKESYNYCFEDIDTGEKFIYSGTELVENGLEINLKEKRSSKLFSYRISD